MFTLDLRSGYIGAAVFAVVAGTVMLISAVAGAEPYSVAPVTEYMLLPKFCWGHFNDELQGEEFYIPRCGGGTNHYCDGLLSLQRSKKAKDIYARKVMLTSAKKDTLYTIGYLKRDGVVESCPIAPHVQQTLQEIELQMQIYHVK